MKVCFFVFLIHLIHQKLLFILGFLEAPFYMSSAWHLGQQKEHCQSWSVHEAEGQKKRGERGAYSEAFHPEIMCVTSQLSMDMASHKATFPFKKEGTSNLII